MTVEEIYSDREGFAKNVRAIAGPDVSKMGIRIISFVIQNITDNVSFNQNKCGFFFCDGPALHRHLLVINNFVTTAHDKSSSYSMAALKVTYIMSKNSWFNNWE